MQTITSTKTEQILSILHELDNAHTEAYKALWELSSNAQPVPGSELDAALRGVNAAAFTVTNSMNNIRKASVTPTYRRWLRDRDKYRRTRRTIEEISATHRHTVGVIVNMPPSYIEKNPEKRFMVNEFRTGPDGRGIITYHSELRYALAQMGVGKVEGQHYELEPKP